LMSISRNTEVSSYYHLNREFKSGVETIIWKSQNCEEKKKMHGTLMFTTQQFHFLPPNRLAECGGKDIQAQTCLFSSKRRGEILSK